MTSFNFYNEGSGGEQAGARDGSEDRVPGPGPQLRALGGDQRGAHQRAGERGHEGPQGSGLQTVHGAETLRV